jgi:hypothetical protein
MAIRTKQKLSGPWSAQQNTKKKIDAVVEAIRKIESREGRRASKPALIAELGAQKVASRSTLYKLWDTVRSLVDCESETVDGKKVLNNAPNCTGSSAESPDQHEAVLESVGAQERMILTPALHTKNAVRPTPNDLFASERISRESAPAFKAADDSISGRSCSTSTQLPARSDRALASTSIGMLWAAQNAWADALLPLMQRLSKLRDAPPRSPPGDVPARFCLRRDEGQHRIRTARKRPAGPPLPAVSRAPRSLQTPVNRDQNFIASGRQRMPP